MTRHPIGSTELVNITTFQEGAGLYYQNKGHVDISHLEWNLITYVDFSKYSQRYATSIAYYNTTSNICQEMQQNHDKTDISQTCSHFGQETTPYLYEIQSNQ